jgi:hypothetical protein
MRKGRAYSYNNKISKLLLKDVGKLYSLRTFKYFKAGITVCLKRIFDTFMHYQT